MKHLLTCAVGEAELPVIGRPRRTSFPVHVGKHIDSVLSMR